MPLPFSTNNTDKVTTRQIKACDGTTVTLTYRREEANELRRAIQRIRLKGDRAPSMSLVARRSMGLYLAHLESSVLTFNAEIQALEKLATPIATRTKTGQ